MTIREVITIYNTKIAAVAALVEMQRKTAFDLMVANAKAAATSMPNVANLTQAHATYRLEQDEQIACLLANKSK